MPKHKSKTWLAAMQLRRETHAADEYERRALRRTPFIPFIFNKWRDDGPPQTPWQALDQFVREFPPGYILYDGELYGHLAMWQMEFKGQIPPFTSKQLKETVILYTQGGDTLTPWRRATSHPNRTNDWEVRRLSDDAPGDNVPILGNLAPLPPEDRWELAPSGKLVRSQPRPLETASLLTIARRSAHSAETMSQPSTCPRRGGNESTALAAAEIAEGGTL